MSEAIISAEGNGERFAIRADYGVEPKPVDIGIPEDLARAGVELPKHSPNAPELSR